MGLPALAPALAERSSRVRDGRLAEKARNTPLDEWLRGVSPTYNWDWPHIRYVREALDRVTSGVSKRLMIFMPPRHGKPVYSGSMILLKNGLRKPISEVVVGDQVITHKGRGRRVLAIHEQGELTTVRITTRQGRSTIAALDHPFLTPEGWVDARNLQVGMALANVPSPKAGGADIPVEAFGMAGHGLYGHTGHGLSTKRVPSFVYTGNAEQIGHFVDAFFACSESINRGGGVGKDAFFEIDSINRELLGDLQHLLLRLGIQSGVSAKQATPAGVNNLIASACTSYRLKISSQDDGATCTHFESPYLEDLIESVEPAGNLPCRCLTVKEDETFTSDDFVVHNSALTTVRYPAYYLQQDPSRRVIVGCYSQELAALFSRQTRRIARSRVPLSTERVAATEWETTSGGGMVAVGVGTGVVGRGANLIIIDDSIKGRKEAMSQKYKDDVWDWYTNDLLTRQEPGCAIINIQCMTGDTPVLLADGTERPLRDIRVGDRIATYDNGNLSTSTVRKHRSNGSDSVYRIKTISGRIVSANARHPFFVEEHGKLKWIRLKHLNTAHKIVTVKDRRANGKERYALSPAAVSLLSAVDIALDTIAGRCGPMGITPPQIIQCRAGMLISRIDTGLPPKNITQSSQHKMESALFADNPQGIMCVRTGVESCALTTILTSIPKETLLEGYCATIATLPWDMPSQKQPHFPWAHTSDFTTEAIESIEPAGTEEVFDLQVDRTENFIANGLVSHNTRWVDDDLAGRILASEEGPEWEVVKLPALAEMNDPLGRMEGEALCAERFDVEALRKIQRMQKTDFNALYQQSPVPRGGGKFKRDWFMIVDRAPAVVQRVITYWDKAGTEGDGDYTVGICMSLATDGIIFIEFMWRDQLGDLARERLIKQATQITQRRRSINVTWLETEGGSAGISDSNATIRALAGFTVYAERPSGSKIVRATPFASYAEAGDVRLVKGDWNEDFLQEMSLFPVGKNDDIVDASSGAFNKLFSGAIAGNLD